MKFKTIAEAFNYYRNYSIEDMETRATAISNLIDTDSNVDIDSLNIELEGIKQAKENLELRSNNPGKAFNPITGIESNKKNMPEDEKIFESTEYRNAFYKQLLGQKLNEVETRTFNRAIEIQNVERRADQFNTITESAAVVPTTTLNEVIKKARTMGGLMAEVRGFTMPTNIEIPIGTPSNKAEWHKEGKKVDSEKLIPTSVKFGSYEILKIFSMSASTKRMSVPAFESYLIEELSNAVMECIADALINGTGTDQGTGLETGITWGATNKVEFATEVAYKDFTKAMALLKRGYSANSKWAMNNTTLYNQVYGLVDGNGRPIFIEDPKSESIGYILGKQVVIDDNIADDVIYLGNYNYMAYNMPQGIMLEVSRESSFKSALIDYRAMAIADTKPLVDEAFIKLSKKA